MATPDYPRSRWYGAYHGNYSRASRPGSNRIDKVVVHVVQGSWSSGINWFNDSRAGVSAHYTVRSSDGFIGQSVQEKDIGYHAGNWPVNQNSIGIEHEGYGDNPTRWFTSAMYNSSARLTAYLCKKYGIPIQRGSASQVGILAHRQATSTACPGQFDFTRYLGLVRYYANQSAASAKYSQVVDNNTPDRFMASENWGTSAILAAQSYGPDYRVALPSNVNDAAYFKLKIPSAGKYFVYAWYPAHPKYNRYTTYWIFTANGWVRRLVNQRINGRRWFHLGTYNMRPGDGYYIFVPRRSPGAGQIIADAVAVVEK